MTQPQLDRVRDPLVREGLVELCSSTPAESWQCYALGRTGPVTPTLRQTATETETEMETETETEAVAAAADADADQDATAS